jgi:hypothetical protein
MKLRLDYREKVQDIEPKNLVFISVNWSFALV